MKEIISSQKCIRKNQNNWRSTEKMAARRTAGMRKLANYAETRNNTSFNYAKGLQIVCINPI